MKNKNNKFISFEQVFIFGITFFCSQLSFAQIEQTQTSSASPVQSQSQSQFPSTTAANVIEKAQTQKYGVQIDLLLHGKHWMAPNLAVIKNKLSTITLADNNEKIFIDVLAKNLNDSETQKPNTILMSYTIGNLGSNNEKIKISTFEIASVTNQTTTMDIATNNDPSRTMASEKTEANLPNTHAANDQITLSTLITESDAAEKPAVF